MKDLNKLCSFENRVIVFEDAASSTNGIGGRYIEFGGTRWEDAED